MIVRKKKKMAYNDLEDHVVTWVVSQLSDIRDTVADIEDDVTLTDDKRDMVLRSFHAVIDSLIDLMGPLRHEEDCLVEWAFAFLDEYNSDPEFSD